jgi:hypothetical protein
VHRSQCGCTRDATLIKTCRGQMSSCCPLTSQLFYSSSRWSRSSSSHTLHLYCCRSISLASLKVSLLRPTMYRIHLAQAALCFLLVLATLVHGHPRPVPTGRKRPASPNASAATDGGKRVAYTGIPYSITDLSTRVTRPPFNGMDAIHTEAHTPANHAKLVKQFQKSLHLQRDEKMLKDYASFAAKANSLQHIAHPGAVVYHSPTNNLYHHTGLQGEEAIRIHSLGHSHVLQELPGGHFKYKTAEEWRNEQQGEKGESSASSGHGH